MLGAIPHTKIQDKENQNDLFLLKRDNQFVWESIGQIKPFESRKEANKTNGKFLQICLKLNFETHLQFPLSIHF